MSDHLAVLEGYRGQREALEAAVLPLATSLDGRKFEYQASLYGLELEVGGSPCGSRDTPKYPP